MTYQEFVSGPAARQRYWARSHLGLGRMRRAEPNDGHRALARLDPDLLITQNVDGLHEAAGSRRLVALHGRIADVVCLVVPSYDEPGAARGAPGPGQPRLRRAAPRRGRVRPDGDVDLDDTDDFVVPDCDGCGGVLKPDVVFFGENVPPARVQRCYDAVDALTPGDALLVVGSSLTVMSGFRFVRRAAKAGVPGGHREPRRRPAATTWRR